MAKKRYLVTWKIDIEDVDNPEAAAREADDAYRRAGSIAHVFEVQEEGYTGKPFGPITLVDLDKLDGDHVTLVDREHDDDPEA